MYTDARMLGQFLEYSSLYPVVHVLPCAILVVGSSDWDIGSSRVEPGWALFFYDHDFTKKQISLGLNIYKLSRN